MIPYLLQSSSAEFLGYSIGFTCCIILLLPIAFIIFLCVILWRASGRKKVEYHTTTVKESGSSDRRCPACGRVIPFDAKSCPYCSKKFEDF